MKIILGQGNPETKYDGTRHNVGFAALDYYASREGTSFQRKEKFTSEIAELSVQGEKILLVKPLTYYNETGKAARALADFYKLDTKDILVIHDELALPFGIVRTREKGSPAGNNGIKSLNAHLGEQYARVRVGTWNELADKMDPFDFVLSRFTSEETEKLQKDIFPKINDIITDFTKGSHTSTSHSL